ncbi:MAG: adenylyl-sulfate kinase, partial [Alphaproteobacteria bacterium]|nr:adenylyl-sulfate kinase [Alphaproteobacteria bacterium]
MSQRPFILWLLGPTSSGKSTLAELLTLALRGREVPIIHFDGDEVRDFFGPGHGFAPADRQRVVATLVHLANKSREAGLNVVVSALTANPDARAYVLASIADLITGFVRCPIEVCAARDPKGLYAKA